MSAFTPFDGRSVLDESAARLQQIGGKIRALTIDELDGVDDEELVRAIVSEHDYELALHFDAATAELGYTEEKRKWYGEMQMCRIPTLRMHIPFAGDPDILRLKPTITSWEPPPSIEVEQGFVIASLAADNQSSVHRQRDLLQRRYDCLNGDFKKFRAQALDQGLSELRHHRQVLGAVGGLAKSLNLPLRRRTDERGRVVLDPGHRKRIIARPEAERSWVISNDVFDEILDLLCATGTAIERSPSLYRSKKEEALRDLLLLPLQVGFEGEASAETFNRNGKTDILLRHAGRNVFVAECKMWRGPKGLVEALKQLFSYATWRDSKRALIVFVTQKKLQAVIDGARSVLESEDGCEGIVRDHGPHLRVYDFLPEGDEAQRCRVALLLFHLPDG